MQQYIYHLDVSANATYSPKISIDRNDNTRFELIDSTSSVIKNLYLLIKRYKLSAELIKLLIKLMTKRNALYIVVFNNTITTEGLISFGKCAHYQVASDDCIIGPVNTDSTYQGKGFATYGLISCVHYLKNKKQYSKIYIDTREDNIAMQKVIEKSAFGEKIANYQRVVDQSL